MDVWRATAARNNAHWCDALCRSHGIEGRFTDAGWMSVDPAPPFYPDVITLRPDASLAELLEPMADRRPCSIKDSFASVDAGPLGFQVLFDAEWVVARSGVRSSARSDAGRWCAVRDPRQLAAWEEAWRGDDQPFTGGLFRAGLLERVDVVIIACLVGERLAAGAVLNHGADVVGISNVFEVGSAAGASPEVWAGCVAAADAHFPGATPVGYESGDELVAAVAAGFEPVGRLRVWSRPG